MKSINQRVNSKTYWLGIAVMVLGYAQTNISQIESFLGEYKGLVNVGIGIAILIMREMTKTPISAKPGKIANPLKS